MDILQCGNCGKPLPPSGGKCPHCGASPEQQEYLHPPAKVPSAAPTPKKRRSNATPQKKPAAPKKSAPVKKSRASSPRVKQKEPKREKRHRSKILIVLMLFWCILAVGVFGTYLSEYSDDSRYLQTGEGFVQALILQDDTALSNYIHKNMRGSLRSFDYGSVDACRVHGTVKEEADAAALNQELSDRYGLKASVVAAQWILVEYTVEKNGQVTSCSIEVLVANIGGDVYVVKTRNMMDSSAFS